MYRIFSLLAALLLLAAREPAWAQEGYYVGAGAGSIDWNAQLESFDDGTLSGGTVDSVDSGWKLFGGYRFSRYFGVEAGYADLGRVTFNGTSSGCPDPDDCSFAAGRVALERAGDAFFGEVVPSLPLGRFDLFAKVGFFSLDIDLDVTDPANAGVGSLSFSETVWGAGAQYRFAGPAVRVEWERITDAPDESVDFYTASLFYQFGG